MTLNEGKALANIKSMDKKSVRTIDADQEGIEVILSFKVSKNGKQIIFYNINNRMLYYALIQKDSTVELSYPIKEIYQSLDFQFGSTTTNLAVNFKNKNATYMFYEQSN
ncbi:hypothetical protein [Sediminibacterium sp.]|uniref:hypothetical protein n=2 Tax=Sediminibacterium sp. TaxID=1917865 RepID=UPI002736EB1C|nr:hypothetical protein [Sediminibacterium sp.]MDP3567224.1 hypothetical protein [Sediminibacterium sp.]